MAPGPTKQLCRFPGLLPAAVFLLGLGFTGCTGCEDLEKDIGATALIASPVAGGLGLGMLAALRALYLRRWPDLPFGWLPTLVMVVVFVSCGIASLVANHGDTEAPGFMLLLIFYALAFFSWVPVPGYLLLLLLVWRLWFAFDPKRSFVWPPMLVLGLCGLQIVPFLLRWEAPISDYRETLLAVWTWFVGLGVSVGPFLLGGAIVEAWFRGKPRQTTPPGS